MNTLTHYLTKKISEADGLGRPTLVLGVDEVRVLVQESWNEEEHEDMFTALRERINEVESAVKDLTRAVYCRQTTTKHDTAKFEAQLEDLKGSSIDPTPPDGC